MKKLFCILLTVCMTLTCASIFSGCSLLGKDDEDTVIEISTADELAQMTEDKSYKLTADIDLGGESWTPVKVNKLDGDGHVISNALILKVGNDDTQAEHGFISEAKEIKNLTLSDITYNLTMTRDHNSFGILVGYVNTLENVTVKNCKATVSSTYKENQVVAPNDTFFRGGVVAGNLINAKNCSVLDCELTYTRKVSSNPSEAYFGGLAGILTTQEENSGLVVKNVKLNWETTSGEYVYAGGLAGEIRGGLTASYATGVELNVSANCDDKFIRVGGFAGSIDNDSNDKSVSGCASINNKLNVINAGGYNVGGFAGKTASSVKDCLSQANELKADTKTKDKELYCGLSGFASVIEDKTVSRCVSQYNAINVYDSIAPNNTTLERVYEAGFVARPISAVVKCASYENQITGGLYKDGFARESDVITDCYLKDALYSVGNVNNLAEPTEAEWADAITLLNLNGELWQISEVEGKQVLVLKLTAGI